MKTIIYTANGPDDQDVEEIDLIDYQKAKLADSLTDSLIGADVIF